VDTNKLEIYFAFSCISELTIFCLFGRRGPGVHYFSFKEQNETTQTSRMIMNPATPNAASSAFLSDGNSYVRRVSTESSDEKPWGKTLLPEDFVPTPYSVVCGRGMKYTKAVGNRRLQVIATMFLHKYSLANRKDDKTEIVTEILEIVKNACPDEHFAFVKYHDGRWWEVETLIAREKIGAVLRDSLHSKYRSSTKSKLARRRAQKRSIAQSVTESDNFSFLTPRCFGTQSNSSIMVVGGGLDGVFS
jgi:hypothetical protein